MASRETPSSPTATLSDSGANLPLARSATASGTLPSEVFRGRNATRSPPSRRSRSRSLSRTERRNKHKKKKSHRSRSGSLASSITSVSTSASHRHKKHKKHRRGHSSRSSAAEESTIERNSGDMTAAKPSSSHESNRRSATIPRLAGDTSATSSGAEVLSHPRVANTSAGSASATLSAGQHPVYVSLATTTPETECEMQPPPDEFLVVDLDDGSRVFCDTLDFPSAFLADPAASTGVSNLAEVSSPPVSLDLTNAKGGNQLLQGSSSPPKSSFPCTFSSQAIGTAPRPRDVETSPILPVAPPTPSAFNPDFQKALQQTIWSSMASFFPHFQPRVPSVQRKQPAATVTSGDLLTQPATGSNAFPFAFTPAPGHVEASGRREPVRPPPGFSSLPTKQPAATITSSDLLQPEADLPPAPPGFTAAPLRSVPSGRRESPSSSSDSSSDSSESREKSMWSPFSEGALSAPLGPIKRAASSVIERAVPHLFCSSPVPSDEHVSLLHWQSSAAVPPASRQLASLPKGLERARQQALRSARGCSALRPEKPGDPLVQAFPKPLKPGTFLQRATRLSSDSHPCDCLLQADPLQAPRLQTSPQDLDALGLSSFQPPRLSAANYTFASSSSRYLASMEVTLAALQSLLFERGDPQRFKEDSSPADVQTLFAFLSRLLEGAYSDSASLAFNCLLDTRDAALASAPSSCLSSFQDALRLAPLAPDSLFGPLAQTAKAKSEEQLQSALLRSALTSAIPSSSPSGHPFKKPRSQGWSQQRRDRRSAHKQRSQRGGPRTSSAQPAPPVSHPFQQGRVSKRRKPSRGGRGGRPSFSSSSTGRDF